MCQKKINGVLRHLGALAKCSIRNLKKKKKNFDSDFPFKNHVKIILYHLRNCVIP